MREAGECDGVTTKFSLLFNILVFNTLLGAYYMKWLNFSFQEALELDDEIAGREVEFLFRNAFQW